MPIIQAPHDFHLPARHKNKLNSSSSKVGNVEDALHPKWCNSESAPSQDF